MSQCIPSAPPLPDRHDAYVAAAALRKYAEGLKAVTDVAGKVDVDWIIASLSVTADQYEAGER